MTKIFSYLMIIFSVLSFIFYPPGFTEDENISEEVENIPEYPKLKASIEAILKTERESVARLEKELNDLKASDKTALLMNTYKVKLSGYANLLVSSKSQAQDLENAWAKSKTALEDISRNLEEYVTKQEAVTQLLVQTEEQYDLNNSQLLEINTEVSNVAEVRGLIEKSEELLIRILPVKISYLESIREIYAQNIHELEDLKKGFAELSEKFDHQIQVKKKEELFRRKQGIPFLLDIKQVREEVYSLIRQISLLFSEDFWKETLLSVWKSERFSLVSCILLSGIFLFLLFRVRRYFSLTIQKYPLSQYPWKHIILVLLNRSLFLLGITLVVYAYAHLRHIYATIPFIRVVIHILLTWIFSQWLLDFISLWNQQDEKKKIYPPLVFRTRILILMIRCFAIPYIMMAWLLKSDSVILLFTRGAFEASLVIWGILFWKVFRESDLDSQPSDISAGGTIPDSKKQVPGPPMVKLSLLGAGDIIVGGGIVLEFAGYGSLALYWYTSWACTLICLLWGGLFFLFLREWNRQFREASERGPDEYTKPPGPIHWLSLQMSWVAWICGFFISVLFAWGAKQTVVVSFFDILNKKITLGGMNLSVTGFVYAFLILLCVHSAVRIWRQSVIEKLLAGSGMGIGLKHSVSSITVYLFWVFGILVALNVAGVSTTSLTVIFGALGIGLGFGLQNIFNNFISGVILLFERPIQVGDVVEINGAWGEVKKINVRSTWVETYNNSSLIIPNSEFISGQVTNWSFKEPKVRRIITIGVAYGSDTKLVRDILLDIADKTLLVFRYPSPYVLFTDFGDSALMFELRFWTDVDNCLRAESEIRFEIDRQFKEKGVQIPFPQRDVHLDT